MKITQETTWTKPGENYGHGAEYYVNFANNGAIYASRNSEYLFYTWCYYSDYSLLYPDYERSVVPVITLQRNVHLVQDNQGVWNFVQ